MAELTVPHAPTTVGRTATVRYDAPQTGSALSALGNRMLEFGTVLENDRLEREMSRVQVNMTRDMGQLRLQVEEMGDPDAAGAAWDTGLAQLREQYQTGTNDYGRPLIDPKNAENFGLAWDDLSERHALSLGGRNLALRQSQRAATYFEYDQTASAEAARTDPGTRDQIYSNFDVETDKQVAAGTMSPEAGAKAKLDFRARTENASAIQMLADDPEGLLDGLDSGEFANQPPEVQARYRVSAQAEIARRAAAAQKASETATKERQAQIGTALGDLIDIAGNGQIYRDEAFVSNPEVQAHPLYGKAMAAMQLRDEKPELMMMSPDDLGDMIEVERKRPLVFKYQTERLNLLEEIHGKTIDGYRKDPISQAGKSGMAVPSLDMSDPESLPAQIAKRVTFGATLVEGGYVDRNPNLAGDVPILTKDEQGDLDELIRGTRDPAARLKLASGIVGAITARGGDPSGIDAIARDPVLAWASGGAAQQTLAPAVATQMLRGQEAIDAGIVKLPTEGERLDPVFDVVADLFADVRGGATYQAQAMRAIDAIYASMVQRTDPNAPIDPEKYRQATHMTFGGTGVAGTSSARGGIQQVNGRRTFLDDGISPAMIEGAVGALRRDLVPFRQGHGVGSFASADRDNDRPARVLGAAAQGEGIEGTQPTINGRPLGPEDWENATFVALGPDRYALMLDRGVQAMAGDADLPFVFSMKRLLSGYRRGRK